MAVKTVALPRGARATVTVTVASNLALTNDPEFALSPLDGYPAADGWLPAAWTTADVVVDGEHRRSFGVLLAGPLAPAGPGTPIAADSLLRGRVQAGDEVLPTDPVRVNLGP